jgi:hypothetical protein
MSEMSLEVDQPRGDACGDRICAPAYEDIQAKRKRRLDLSDVSDRRKGGEGRSVGE